MPRLAAALLILMVTTTSCSRPEAKPQYADKTEAATSTILRHVVATAPDVTTTSPIQHDQTPTRDSRPVVAVVNQSPEGEARSLIQRLIDQDSTIPNSDAELWTADLDGGSIVQVATLARSADRAEVAVSIAFVTAVAGEPAEPIGIRVQLDASDGNWIVDGISYL